MVENLQNWQVLFAVVDSMRERVLDNEYFPANPFLSLTISQARMFRYVVELQRQCPEGVGLKLLADKIRVSPAAASEMVDVLVRKGALVREPSPVDRRAVCIRLAPKTEKKIVAINRELDVTWERLLDGISAEERLLWDKMLRKIFENSERECVKC